MPIKLGSAYGEIRVSYDGSGVRSALTALGGLAQTIQTFGGMIERFVVEPLIGIGREVVGVAADFESQMAIMSTAVDTAEVSMQAMHDASIAVGEDTRLVGVSASTAAESITGLLKAGLDTTDIFGDMNAYLEEGAELGGALRASVDLAAASELELGQASEVVAIAMATFGLNAEDATRIADSFVKTADASVASVSGLADALVNVGPTAAAFGWSMEDVNVALGLLSERGIQGAEAGTALKSMMTNLMRPTDDAVSTLRDLNVALYDETGSMRSLPDIMADLESGLSTLTEEQRNTAVQTLAGTYGMKAMNTLLAEGSAGWEGMVAAIGEASSVQDVAQARTNTFAGAMEALDGVLETLKIRVGETVLPVLTDLARQLAEFVSEHAPQIQAAMEQVVTWLTVNVPAAIATTVDFWQNQLLPALQVAWAFIQENVIPVLAEMWAWLQVNVPAAIQTLSDFWTNTLQPALQVAWAFIQENIVPILAGLAAIVVAVVVPALIAWAGAAISAAAATVAALAPVILPILAIGAAVGLLVAAWQNNWGGIRDTLTAVWEGTLRPALEQLWAWLQVNIPIALETLRTFWETVLLPAIQAVWAWITGTLFPMLADVWTWLATNIPAAIQTVSNFWTGTLLPAIQAVWAFITDYLVPLFEALWNLIEVVLSKAIEILTAAWENVLYPALEKVWAFIAEKLQPILDALKKFWDESLGPVLQDVATLIEDVLLIAWEKLRKAFDAVKTDVLEKVKAAFDDIKKAIKDVTGFFGDLASSISAIKIPDWLKGHSPPPMADWFSDIAAAADMLATLALPRVEAGLAIAAPAGLGAVPGGAGTGAGGTRFENYGGLHLSGVQDMGDALQQFQEMMI